MKNPLKRSVSEDFWSEWQGSNLRHRHPKCRALPTAPHPDSIFNCGRVGGQICGQTQFWLPFFICQTAQNPHGWRVFGGFRFRAVRTPSMLPKQARYQLRYTPIVIKLWSCKWSNLWSNTFLTAFFHFPNRPKYARLKGFRRFSLSCGANTVYAPKTGAVPSKT